MMKFIIRKTLLAVLILTITTFVYAQQEKPETFANRFYKTYLKLRIRGLPDQLQLRLLALYPNRDLYKLFEKARFEQKEYIKKNPENKPPWIEGDMFTSLFEGAQSFKLGKTKIKGNNAEVVIELKYQERDSIVNWNDRLILIKSKKSWRVRDILFDGDWQFKNGNSLRQILGAK